MCESESFICKYEYVLVHCTQQCITFTHNLPDSNAMLLSGRVPGYKESDVKLLVSTIIYHTIWELYLQAAATTSMRAVAHPSPSLSSGGSIVVMKPMKDLCWICQPNSGAIMHSENRPEEEKSTVSTHAS